MLFLEPQMRACPICVPTQEDSAMFLEGMLISLSVVFGLIWLNIYLRVLLFLHDRKSKKASRQSVIADVPRERERDTKLDEHRDSQ